MELGTLRHHVVHFFCSLVSALVAFCETLLRGCGAVQETGSSFLLKKAVSQGISAWRSCSKNRRLDLYDLNALDDPFKNGYIFPEIEWELEAPQPEHRIREHVDEFLCWGCNSSGESLLVWVAREPGGAVRACFRLRDADGRTWGLTRAAFADGSNQESRRFSAGRLHLTCLQPMRKWRIAFNGHLREKTVDGTGETQHVELRMFVNAITEVYDHDSDTSAEARALFLAQGSWGGLAGDMPRHDAYEQPVNMFGTLSVASEASPSRELRLWGLRQRMRGRRNEVGSRTSHYLGTLESRIVFHVSSENVNGATLKRGFVMAPNLFLHAVDLWKKTEEDGHASGLHMETVHRVYDVRTERLNGETGLEIADEDSCLEVVEPLRISTDTSRGQAVQLVFHRKPLTWKPQTIIRIPESKKESEQKRVVCLGDGAAWDSRVCGGKASSLAALAAMAPLSREKFNVPGAVVLTTRAYADFRAHNKLDECLAELATYPKLNGDQRKALASRLCEAVERAKTPVNLVADLEAQLRRSIGDNFVHRSYAVRSSAVGEDSEEMSCAGQMETFLNVRGLQEASLCAVKCWASQFRHPALEYKWQHGQELEAPMAVLIQEMAQADVAGVLFTCDPVSGDPSRLVINANYGLGESVVSSLAEPDTVTLGRSEDGQLTLLEKHLGKKQMQVRAAAHGTEVQQAKNTDECCLSDEEALALGRAALEVERLHPGTPDLDLEWAIVEGELYLLQARPITSLHRQTDFEVEHNLDNGLSSEDEFYTRANVGEVLPGAISALGLELFLHSFNIVFMERVRKARISTLCPKSVYFRPSSVIVSRNYMMSLIDGMFQHSEKKDLLTKGLFFGTLGRCFESDDVVAKFLERHGRPLRTDPLRRVIFLVWAQLKKGDYMKVAQESIKNFEIPLKEEHTAQEMYDIISRTFVLPPEVILNLLICSMLSSFYNLMVLLTIGSFHGDLTPEVFADVATLLSKCEQVESAEVPSRLKELSSVLRKFRPDFGKLSIQDARAYLEKSEEEPSRLYRDLIKNHGHRSIKEFDVLTLTWELDPEPLIKILQDGASREETTTKESAPAELITPLNFWRRHALRILVPQTKRAVANREGGKALVVRSIHIFRLALRKLGRKMVEEGRLPDPDLVFQLEMDELHRLLKTRSPALVLRAIRRHRIHPTLNRLRFPDIVRGIPRPVTRVDRAKNGSVVGDVSVKGTPVSRGSVTAPARVVKTLDAAGSIEPGDILITNATDIGWSPYFPLLAGIVTEIGGLLSHGAVIAREYGLPCIVGVENATDIFVSGDTILLDATRGTVGTVKTDAS
ncbi:putative phosphoenolpyruvate synthase [Ixodes scapularis]|uniref:putative phosphoenolpyruvate synthase n=1 Tax=Ixodes scapularis TaxID=6945 RepID=UPI001A9E3147|nr:putative phosphoenolpyruvate synthase [Ixodes scapularis]